MNSRKEISNTGIKRMDHSIKCNKMTVKRAKDLLPIKYLSLPLLLLKGKL
jgi:hypothetical protein